LAYIERLKKQANSSGVGRPGEVLDVIALAMSFAPVINTLKEKASLNQIDVFMKSLSFEQGNVNSAEFMDTLSKSNYDLGRLW